MQKIIDRAFDALGGETPREAGCQCDPEVGINTCQVCAILDALKLAKKLYRAVEVNLFRLGEVGCYVKVCEGMGEEDKLASLAVSIAKAIARIK